MRAKCIVGVLYLLTAAVAGAATLHVPLEYPTIQAGVDSASVGDTVLVAPGTYTGTGNRDIHFWGKDIALVSSAGPASTVIDCEDETRAFLLQESVTRDALIEGFTVLNGFGTGSGGGAIFGNWLNGGASPTVRHCVFSGCLARGVSIGHDPWPAFGGAVYICYGGDPLFEGCSFIGNEIMGAPSWGTDIAIYNSAVTLLSCLFAYGVDNSPYNEEALGIDGVGANFTIDQCLFTDSGDWPGYVQVTNPGLCDWYPGSQSGFELCSDSPALPENNDWGVLVGAFGAGCGPCATVVERTSWGTIKAMFR